MSGEQATISKPTLDFWAGSVASTFLALGSVEEDKAPWEAIVIVSLMVAAKLWWEEVEEPWLVVTAMEQMVFATIDCCSTA